MCFPERSGPEDLWMRTPLKPTPVSGVKMIYCVCASLSCVADSRPPEVALIGKWHASPELCCDRKLCLMMFSNSHLQFRHHEIDLLTIGCSRTIFSRFSHELLSGQEWASHWLSGHITNMQTANSECPVVLLSMQMYAMHLYFVGNVKLHCF